VGSDRDFKQNFQYLIFRQGWKRQLAEETALAERAARRRPQEATTAPFPPAGPKQLQRTAR
jgi:hypothetical protein